MPAVPADAHSNDAVFLWSSVVDCEIRAVAFRADEAISLRRITKVIKTRSLFWLRHHRPRSSFRDGRAAMIVFRASVDEPRAQPRIEAATADPTRQSNQ